MPAPDGQSLRTEGELAGLRTSRVCDRCIINKVKCDLKKPLCSRCAERDYACVYSWKRRKPGPAKGFTRSPGCTRRKSTAAASTRISKSSTTPSSREPDARAPFPLSPPALSAYEAVTDSASADTINTEQHPREVLLGPEEERLLLRSFFEQVQPAMPIFAESNFFERYEAGFVDQDLILTTVAITAKLVGASAGRQGGALDLYLERALESSSHQNFQTSDFQSLDQFRKVCLLAYYEFHQSPGQRAWMRIGRLTRHAYRMGLNQLENPRLCSVLNLGLATDIEIEEWRYIWWCIYCFDSYSNMSSGTPYLVELEGINTALPREVLKSLSHTMDVGPPKVFLSTETDSLWKTLQDIRTNTRAINFNIHIVTTTILREVGSIVRLMTQNQNPSDRVRQRMANVQTHLHALRLSLPSNHLKPTRDVMRNETCADHHVRLTTVLHVHLAQLLISVPRDFAGDEVKWVTQWHEMLGSCHNIASVVAHWDNQFSPSVDPAVCFIVFVALLAVTVQAKCEPTGDAKDSDLNSSAIILSLFLEQFAKIWALPKRLLALIVTFQNAIPGPITYKDIRNILSFFPAPLHPMWTTVALPYPAFGGGDANGFDFPMDSGAFDFEAFLSTDVSYQ